MLSRAASPTGDAAPAPMPASTQAHDPAEPRPVGTVTFLFTDIEGSTRLWEHDRAAMEVALPRHDALIRQSIASNGGHVFKTGGDAFCAAFRTAPEAIAAALDAQRALHRERWPANSAIRVRMAVHTGAAEHRDGDYFGTPLNRVARLLAAGHGGQTLLSESTHDLARDHMPPLATAKALGAHGLKDLARKEAVYQLCHPDLPRDFPPLRATQAPLDRVAPSIAVLPFVNMSRDEDNEYFADGLSEELLNVLAKIRGLRVASRTSAFYFKGKDIDLGTVAQKLGVATVLEGSVRKSGKRVRITAQLIEASSDSHLWSETYDRELDDIFAVQDDIAQSVVKELRAALLGERIDAGAVAAAEAEVKAAAAGRADDPEAYRLYLQGRFLLDRLNLAEVKRSIELFHQALGRDPGFALAWCGLSQAYAIEAGYGGADVAEGYERAREAAKRALATAPDSADAYVRLGQVYELYDWDWPAANDAYQHALALAPNNPTVLLAVAGITRVLGGAERAIELYRRAIALDPLSSAAHRALGLRLLRMGRLDEASAAIATALEINPSAGLVWCLVAAIRREQGRLDEALAAAERERLPDFRQLALGMVHHAMGHREAADAALRKLSDEWAHAAAYQIAMLHAMRGEVDAAFQWLERAYAQRDPGLVNLAGDTPFARALHSDARWMPFLRRMKLA
jgi:TolB-like protein/class 3 adenylate cyclase/Tfp pilus assembly protein PilF